jgi:hypothetical protein
VSRTWSALTSSVSSGTVSSNCSLPLTRNGCHQLVSSIFQSLCPGLLLLRQDSSGR